MLTRNNKQFTRPDPLHGAVLGMACLPVVPLVGWAEKQREFVEPSRVPFLGSDDALRNVTARQHFADAEIQDLATKIYERVDRPWMLNGGKAFSMGWGILSPGSSMHAGNSIASS